MIRAVLDTNVLASGIVTFNQPTPPAQVLKKWQAGEFQMIVSQPILEELKKTLEKPYFQKYISPQQVAGTISLFEQEAIVAPITIPVQGVATHSEDDLIIATAVSARANYLVTGDEPLLRKVGNFYQGVTILTPKGFLKKL